MGALTIANLSKSYYGSGRTPQVVFDNFSLALPLNSIVSIIGANGSGKTTLLNCIAGLIKHAKGAIEIDGNGARGGTIGFIFQNYRESLMPWLKNIDNIACVFERTDFSKSEKHDYIKGWANGLGVSVPWDKYPYQSSGGEQQLVALLRELVNEPKLLLMDEPFAALDYEKRLAWHGQLLNIWQKTRTTIILVSHDIDEAIYLADEVLVLGKSPSTVAGRFAVPLPRPRALEMLTSETFFRFRSQVLEAFKKTVSSI